VSEVLRTRSTVVSSASTIRHTTTYSLPKIEIRKFNGKLAMWIWFWAQFQKIHEDDSLHNSDKFQYLFQSMIWCRNTQEQSDFHVWWVGISFNGAWNSCGNPDMSAACLYPLIKSSLPEETIKMWQCSALSGYGDEVNDKPVNERLTALMKFLHVEVTAQTDCQLSV
jgi:hypothetical protein